MSDKLDQADETIDIFDAVVRERDMLRAEREVWGNIAQERNELRAEVERLRNQHHNDRVLLAHATSAEVAMLQQEIERLDKQWREIVATVTAGNVALEAEIERLRAFIGRVVGAYAVDEWITEEGRRLLDGES